MTTRPDALSITDLTVTYNAATEPRTAVAGVSLNVAAGSAVGLVGESGSGKTTVGNAVLRALPRGTEVTGSVVLEGKETATITESEFQPMRWTVVSMVFQNALEALNPVYSIGDQLTDVMVRRGGATPKDAKARAEHLLSEVDLDPRWMNRFPHELSGGMKQRVMIAMALLCRPQLLICDEPTTALDVIVRQQIIELLQEVRRETGISLLVISHDLEMIARLCDEVCVMYAGQLVERGSRDDVLNRPLHPYTKALMSAYPKLDGPLVPLTALRGNPPDMSRTFEGCRFADRCPMAQDICLTTAPPRDGSDQHWGLCHFAAEVAP